MKIIKFEIIFLLSAVCLYWVRIHFKDYFSDFIGNIMDGLLIAIITTICFSSYEKLLKYFNSKKYIGFWMTLSFDTEKYVSLNSFVEIKKSLNDVNVLEYYYQDLASLNEINGKIFINKNNTSIGKLISNFVFANSIISTYPILSHDIYFNKSDENHALISSVITIIDSSGSEKMRLERPLNQKYFKDEIMRQKDCTLNLMAGNNLNNIK